MKILLHLVLISTLACGTLMAQGNPRVKAAEDAKKAAEKQNGNGNKNKNGNKNNKTEKEREQAKRQREREREMANNKGGGNNNKGGANANRNQQNNNNKQANKPAPQPKKADENPRMTVNRPPNNNGNQPKVASNQKNQSPQAREQAARAAEANARQREQRKELTRKMNPETANYLRDHNRGRGNWEEEQRRHREHAHHIEDKDDADNLIWTILGSAAAGAVVGNIVSKDRTPQRLPYDQVGRTDVERRDSVNYMVNRFQGNQGYQSPPGYNTGGRYGYDDHGHHQPHYYDGNRRVVYYNSREEIPPVLMAYDRLDRVNVSPYQDSPYRYEGGQGGSYYSDLPESYRGRDAYAVSYPVDPNSAMSRDDILFQQGSTDFADAYSYDIVVDMAEAMRSSQLSNERFIIEGHASAEGDYSSNLRLSQQRAERIARDLVDMGVDPNRLIPVGYGEAEAQYPADYAENYRALDRRVMVFTSAQ